jgi:hypothetical protein
MTFNKSTDQFSLFINKKSCTLLNTGFFGYLILILFYFFVAKE